MKVETDRGKATITATNMEENYSNSTNKTTTKWTLSIPVSFKVERERQTDHLVVVVSHTGGTEKSFS